MVNAVRDLVVAAEMNALDSPYVVVCTNARSSLCFVQGPYPDPLSALEDWRSLVDSPERDEGSHYTIAPLWPASSHL